MGNSVKLIFYAKELIGDLACKPKYILDPFTIAKLDIPTISNFKFPVIQQSMNKYTMLRKGIAGAEYILLKEKEMITNVAKDQVKKEKDQEGLGRAFEK